MEVAIRINEKEEVLEITDQHTQNVINRLVSKGDQPTEASAILYLAERGVKNTPHFQF